MSVTFLIKSAVKLITDIYTPQQQEMCKKVILAVLGIKQKNCVITAHNYNARWDRFIRSFSSLLSSFHAELALKHETLLDIKAHVVKD